MQKNPFQLVPFRQSKISTDFYLNKTEIQTLIYGYIHQFTKNCPSDLIQMIICFGNSIYSIKVNLYKDYEKSYKIETMKRYFEPIHNITASRGFVGVLLENGKYACHSTKENYGFVLLPPDFSNPIKQVFYNACVTDQYLIDENNKIYKCNKQRKLGIEREWTFLKTPVQIDKIGVGQGYIVLLSKEEKQLWVCGNNKYGNGYEQHEKSVNNGINKIQLKNEIIDICCGRFHTMALDFNGHIWSWGRGANGRLGHGNKKHLNIPRKINYFIENAIQIEKICCGQSHNIVLSGTGKV